MKAGDRWRKERGCAAASAQRRVPVHDLHPQNLHHLQNVTLLDFLPVLCLVLGILERLFLERLRSLNDPIFQTRRP
eukprot:2839849-Prymnesium_polylepis.1